MSTAKRSRGRPSDIKSASPLPASKRQKTTDAPHVPKRAAGLNFLVDEDARAGKKLEARYVNGAPRVQAEQSKNKTQITSGEPVRPVKQKITAYIELSSGGEESSEYETDEDDGDERTLSQAQPGATALVSQFEDDAPLLNGHATEDQANNTRIDEDEDAKKEEESAVEDEPREQTFGDQLRARHPEPIDTRDPLYDDSQAVVPGRGIGQVTAFSGTSLTTVLTQSLKTNDKELLERCLQTREHGSIGATIERLNPQLGSQLLERLAEIIYQRPGRTGHLMTWIQSILVAQGAYIASQPDVVERLKVLQQVLKQRASGIEPLLHLRGKLDLLEAQLAARRKLLEESRAQSEDEEQPTIYDEGRNGDAWSESDVDMDDVAAGARDSRSTLAHGSGSKEQRVDDDERIVHINGNLPAPSSSRSAPKAGVAVHKDPKTQDPPARGGLTNGVKHVSIPDSDEDDDESDILNGAEDDDEDDDRDDEGEDMLDVEAEVASDEDDIDGEPDDEDDALDHDSASLSEDASSALDEDELPTPKLGLEKMERKR